MPGKCSLTLGYPAPSLSSAVLSQEKALVCRCRESPKEAVPSQGLAAAAAKPSFLQGLQTPAGGPGKGCQSHPVICSAAAC